MLKAESIAISLALSQAGRDVLNTTLVAPSLDANSRYLTAASLAEASFVASVPLLFASINECYRDATTTMEPAIRSGTLSHMNDKSASVLQFLKGQEICQIAFGMYDLQINWGDGGLSCTGRVIYTPSAGEEVVWTEGHPFDAVPVLRLLQQIIEAFDGSSEGELRLQFSNGDRLTVLRDDGPEGFTIHQIGQRLCRMIRI